MATDNPKISAYVPQTVYDRFNQFKEENNLSMSQAVIKILSEYFNIPLGSDISNEFTSSLPSRLESFDAQLFDLKQNIKLLSERVDFIQSTSRLPSQHSVGEPVSVIVNHESSRMTSHSTSELLVDTPVNIESEPVNQISLNSSESPSKSLVKSQVLPVDVISDLLNKFPIDTSIQPLNTSGLAKRFNISQTMISKIKKYPIDKQIEYTKSKDNGRGWVFVESAKLFYPLIPVEQVTQLFINDPGSIISSDNGSPL